MAIRVEKKEEDNGLRDSVFGSHCLKFHCLSFVLNITSCVTLGSEMGVK